MCSCTLAGILADHAGLAFKSAPTVCLASAASRRHSLQQCGNAEHVVGVPPVLLSCSGRPLPAWLLSTCGPCTQGGLCQPGRCPVWTVQVPTMPQCAPLRPWRSEAPAAQPLGAWRSLSGAAWVAPDPAPSGRRFRPMCPPRGTPSLAASLWSAMQSQPLQSWDGRRTRTVLPPQLAPGPPG